MSDQNNKINKKAEIDLAELLKKDAPYLVEDGKVNLDKLDGLLTGKITEKEDDRFYFNWAGKDKVFQAIQAPAYSTLAPQKDKSIGWDETENLMIVGENLETLKLLLKPYFGKVKVIYIDPPYNTGKDFIYKDDFSSPLKDYLERTGQKSADGERLTTNSETNGRYHSDWLNFMYPRLFMARNLLREDGVIFVSIDDYEMPHLRIVLNDIFGEDNSLTEAPTTLIWQRAGTTAGHFANSHEYILGYAKNKNSLPFFKLDDYGENGAIKHGALKKISRANPASDITFPVGFEFEGKDATFEGEVGGSEKEIIEGKMVFKDGKLVAPVTIKAGWAMRDQVLSYISGEPTYDTKGQKIVKFFFNQQGILWYEKERGTIHPKTIIPKEIGSTQAGSKEIIDIFGEKVFDFPKPSTLVQYLLSFTSSKEDIVLDFFAGSGTTAHALFNQNEEDKLNRKFIIVQLDEPVDETKESGKNAKQIGLNTVAEICIERLKRVSESNEKKLKYKVFKLSPSNFNLKEEFELTENKDLGELKSTYLKELGLYVDQPTIATANTLDIVYEIILKNGFSLNSKIEELKLGSNNFYKVRDTENELEIHISLDAKIEDGSVEAIRTIEYKGKTFAFYDNALTDSQKINLNTFVKLQVI